MASEAVAAFLCKCEGAGEQTRRIIQQIADAATDQLNAQWSLASALIVQYAGVKQEDRCLPDVFVPTSTLDVLTFPWTYNCVRAAMENRICIPLRRLALKWRVNYVDWKLSEHTTDYPFLAHYLAHQITVQICKRLS